MITYSAPDLTQHPPRSPRVRLGGYLHLPRLLDKARAFAAGKIGEYIYPCPLDKRFFTFTGIDPEAFLAAVKAGKGDVEMLRWVNEQTKPVRAAWEIESWSRWLEALGPGDAQRHAGMAEDIKELSPGRDDIRTNFDRLDLDDYISFGGKA
ncbi:MAG TPA: DUF5069 domain-containing protein [Opitutaceae bacterium]|nr:DUF5069 domain-containing protein [Opitutaceae bacterium]